MRAAEWLQRRELNVTPMTVGRSAGAVAREITVHPVRDHLGAITWDGVPRIEAWACRYLGAEDTAFNRSVGGLWLISAVARIFRPGVKADHMLVLEGPQGARKSTALKILAGEDWFTDELPDLGSKDAAMHMQGVWIIEIAEIDAIGKAEVSRIKAFLTRTTDRFRPPFGCYTIDVPRQCVFAGTVNPDTYLRDETGNRQFWPVRRGTIDIDALARDRDQLWAEAVARFRTGAIWWLDTPRAHRRRNGRAGQALPDRRVGRPDRPVAHARGQDSRRLLALSPTRAFRSGRSSAMPLATATRRRRRRSPRREHEGSHPPTTTRPTPSPSCTG